MEGKGIADGFSSLLGSIGKVLSAHGLVRMFSIHLFGRMRGPSRLFSGLLWSDYSLDPLDWTQFHTGLLLSGIAYEVNVIVP